MKRLPARVRSSTPVAVSAARSVQMGSPDSCWFRIKTAELLRLRQKDLQPLLELNPKIPLERRGFTGIHRMGNKLKTDLTFGPNVEDENN